MGLLPDSPSSLYVTFGLNNIVAQETRVEIKPIYDSSSERPNGAADRLKKHIWPALKKGISSSLTDSSKMGRKIDDSHTALPSVSFEPAPNQSFSMRRQITLAELRKAPMAASHRPRMDSPTIPGRFPIHGRSISAPEASANKSLFERSFQEPVSGPLILLPEEDNEKVALSFDADLRETKTTAENVLPCGLKESNSFVTTSNNQFQEEEDRPPAVPPKSPRLTNHATHSTTTLPDISEPHTVPSASVNTTLPPRAATAMEMRQQHIVTELHRRNESAPIVPISSRKAQHLDSGRNKHKYERPEAAVPKRDRSKRRRSLLGERVFKKIPVSEEIKFAQLPAGFHLPDAKSQFTSSDVEKLHKQAKTQAEKFKVLQYHEVKALSKELRVLDARCEYLRSTSKALRAGRNDYHARVIAHLQSSRSVSNSRENILKQEEALAQIDRSIDEWIAKLEQVDNRRARVRQMLLEHIAASLILSANHLQDVKQEEIIPVNTEGNEGKAEQASLEDVARESIRIYADCGVYSDADMADLLADIEHQMKTMSDSSLERSVVV